MKLHLDTLEENKTYYVCALVNSIVGKPLRKVEPIMVTAVSREAVLKNAKVPPKFKADIYILKTAIRTGKINWEKAVSTEQIHCFTDFDECKKYYIDNLL